jgi:glycosyltransferase involved in cell wall biosynthesis
MRIGIDARFYGPDSKGLGRYTQKLITHLEQIDHDNTYVIFLRRDNFELYIPRNPHFIKVVADFQWYSFAEQLFMPFLLYKHRCDVIHFPHFNVPLLYFGTMIVTIHDLILLRFPTRRATTHNILFYWIKYTLYRFVIFCAVRRARDIIAVSAFTRADICDQYSFACKKTHVIHEAGEFMHIRDNEDFLKQCGIIKPYMLYVGNAYPHKNLSTLIDAFAEYLSGDPTVRQLVLVGKDDFFYRQLTQYIRQKNIESIRILHTVNDDQLHTLYRHAVLFVFPSLYEGFGLPPLEAQFCKVPVLSSDHPCMREILSNDGAYFADAHCAITFGRAMKDVMSDSSLRKKLVVHGFNNAQKYSWRKMVKKTHAIYTMK